MRRKREYKPTHHIPTPAPRPTRSEMRQTRRETRDRSTRADTRAPNQAVHLDRAQREIMHQAVTCRDEVGTLLDDGSPRGLVRCVDHEGEVLGSHEGGTGGCDEGEAFGEPCCRFGESWEVACLPSPSQCRRVGHRPDVLLYPMQDITKRPSTLTKVRAQGMSKIIRVDDMAEGVHPPFQTAIGQ